MSFFIFSLSSVSSLLIENVLIYMQKRRAISDSAIGICFLNKESLFF